MSNSEMSSFLQLVDSDSLDAILNCDEIAPSVQVTTSQLHQAMLSPAPLPEPDFGVSPSDDHENDEVFQAALELLDEAYDTASERGHQLNQPPKFSAEGKDASCTVEFEAGSSLGKAANATTKGQRRISTKQHIDQLRDTVNELTSQLHSLESGFTRAQIVESGDRSADSRGSVWQHIATRQLERRLEAEKDNARLRTMLDIQVQEAKSLRRLLKRRKKIEMMEKMLGLKRQKLPVIDKNGDKDGASFAILKEMLRNTDEAYIDIDREFASKAMDQVPCPGKTREENRCAMNDVFLEIMEKQLVPFTVKRTERAVWDALGQVGMQTLQCVKDIDAQVDFYAQNRQETDDTLMISYVAATAGFRGSESRTIRIRKVMRKYVEENRTVFICRMQTQSEGVRLPLRCCIRVVVEQGVAVEGHDAGVTLIKSQYTVSRHAPSDENFQSYANVDMAIAVWEETIYRVSTDIENILLDEATQSH